MVSLAAPGPVAAQTTDSAAEAKQHYEEGTKAYSLGEFPRAITEFKAAYNAKAEPTLLFNIAQSYRLAGDPNQALFFYRSYLRNKPDAINRRDVERRIKELEKQIADGKGAATAVGAAAAAPATSTGSAPAASPVGTPPPAATSPSPPVAPSAAPMGTAPPPAGASTPAPVQPLPSATATQPPPVTTLPPPPPAPAPAPGPTTVVAKAEDTSAGGSPFYTRWWFWTGVGVVALIGVAAAVSASRQKLDHDDFGGPYKIDY